MRRRIPADRLLQLIDEASEIASLERISFTGGEPFLLGKELVDATRRAATAGFRVTAMTSGYWAATPLAARRRLEPLASAGLRDVSFSTGTYHAAFVPAARVVHGAIAAAELGLDVSVSVEVFAGSTFDRRVFASDAAFANALAAGRIRLFERPWIGHADEPAETAPVHDESYARFLPERISGCPFSLAELTVTPALDLAACCGHPIESIRELRIGSVARMTLREAVEAAPDAPLLEMLRVYGPERMYGMANAMNPSVALPLASAHACRTCTLLHRDEPAREILREIARIGRREIAAEFEAVAGSPADRTYAR